MNIIGAFADSFLYHISSSEKQKQIQQKRLKKLVAYAKKNSPKLSELYADIGDDFSLQDLPVTDKQMIMENFNDWVTDRSISFDELKKFTDDKSNIGTLFMGKYIVAATSGSTGYPLLYLLDKPHQNTTAAESMLDNAMKHHPICMLYSGGSFLVSTGILLENMKRFPFIKGSIKLLDSSMPLPQLIEQLNTIKPKSIFAYVSTMEQLSEEYIKGNLKVELKEIVCGGEKLSENMRQYLKETFGCNVKSMYGCTEAGNVAYECDCGHFHIFNGWNIIEPVDADNNPVPCGQRAEKILLTNLANRTMPIIRYEVTDSVILHDDICECGKKSPWIEVEGRAVNKLLVFKSGDKEIKISPISVYVLLETMPQIRLFQFILHGYDRIELRITFMPDADEQAVFEEAKATLTDYLHSNGVDNVEIYLSDKQPQIDPKTLKLKTVYQEL